MEQLVRKNSVSARSACLYATSQQTTSRDSCCKSGACLVGLIRSRACYILGHAGYANWLHVFATVGIITVGIIR